MGTLITAGITVAITAIITLFSSTIISWALGLAFDISSSIMSTGTFSFKLDDIFKMLPELPIDYKSIFLAIGYSVLGILVLFSILKAMASPITGTQTKNPINYLIKGVVTMFVMMLIFGVGNYKGLINWAGEQMNTFMSWATTGFLGSNGKLAITSESIVSQVKAATGDLSSILNFTGDGKVSGIACIVFAIAICSGCIQAAITYVERYLSLALYLALGPICIGFSASDETKGTTLEWVKGVFSQFLTILVSVLCWRMFFVQVVKTWSYFNLAICLAILALIKHSEKLVNMMGFRTMVSGEAARSFGGAFKSAQRMASDIGRFAHMAGHHYDDLKGFAKEHNQAKEKLGVSRMNAKTDADIAAANRQFKLNGGHGSAEKAWNSFKKQNNINDGITGEFGLSARKADKINQDYANKIGGYQYRNISGLSSYKAYNNELAKAETKAKKVEDGVGRYANMTPDQRTAKAADIRSKAYNKVYNEMTPQGKALKNEIDAVNASAIKERNEGLRGVGMLGANEIKQENGLIGNGKEVGKTFQQPLSQEAMSAIERNAGSTVQGRLDSADNSTIASLKNATSFNDVNKAIDQRKASYQSNDSAYSDPDMPMPALNMSPADSQNVRNNVETLYAQAVNDAHGDGELINKAQQDRENAYASIYGANSDLTNMLSQSYYVPKMENEVQTRPSTPDETTVTYSPLSMPQSCPSAVRQSIDNVNDVFAGRNNYVEGSDIATAFGLTYDDSLIVKGGVSSAVETADGNKMACLLVDVYNKETGEDRLMAIMPNNVTLPANSVITPDKENIAASYEIDTSKRGMQLCEGIDSDYGYYGTYVDTLVDDEDAIEKDSNLKNLFTYFSKKKSGD